MSMCRWFLHIALSHEVSSSNKGIFESQILLPVDISVFVAVWLCSSSCFSRAVSCYHRVGFEVVLQFLWLQLLA